MEKFLLRPKEVAELCDVGEGAVRDWVKNDPSFPAFAIGCDVHIPVDDLRAWLSERARLRVGLKTHESRVAALIKKKRAQVL